VNFVGDISGGGALSSGWMLAMGGFDWWRLLLFHFWGRPGSSCGRSQARRPLMRMPTVMWKRVAHFQPSRLDPKRAGCLNASCFKKMPRARVDRSSGSAALLLVEWCSEIEAASVASIAPSRKSQAAELAQRCSQSHASDRSSQKEPSA